jgi:hypothetical protein
MNDRVTLRMLEKRIDYLNAVTGSPKHPYRQHNDGTVVAQIGCYYLEQNFNGVNLARVSNERGAISQPLGQGSRTKAVLYEQIGAYLNGFADGLKKGMKIEV